jgi:hypothetical protein
VKAFGLTHCRCKGAGGEKADTADFIELALV